MSWSSPQTVSLQNSLNPQANEFKPSPPKNGLLGKDIPISWRVDSFEVDDTNHVLNGNKLSFEDQYSFLWDEKENGNKNPSPDKASFTEDQFSFLWEEQVPIDQLKKINLRSSLNQTTSSSLGSAPEKTIQHEEGEGNHTFLWEKFGRNGTKSASNSSSTSPIPFHNQPSFPSSQLLATSSPMPIKQANMSNHTQKPVPVFPNDSKAVAPPNNNHKRTPSNSATSGVGGSFGSFGNGLGSFNSGFSTPTNSPSVNGFQFGKDVGSPSQSSWKNVALKNEAKPTPTMNISWEPGARKGSQPITGTSNGNGTPKEVSLSTSFEKSIGSPKFPTQFSPEKLAFLANLSTSPDVNNIKMSPLDFLESIFIGLDRDFLLQAMEANDFDIKRTMQFIIKQIRGTDTETYVPPPNPTPPNSASSSYNEKFIKPVTEPPVKKNGATTSKKPVQDEQAPICKYFLKGSCLIKNCPFRHTTEVACKYWLRGFCSRGEQCDYKHSIDMSSINRVFEGIDEMGSSDPRENPSGNGGSGIMLSHQEFPSLRDTAKR